MPWLIIHLTNFIKVILLTWFSETVGGKLLHGAEIRTELLPLFRVPERVDHPDTHAAGRGGKRHG